MNMVDKVASAIAAEIDEARYYKSPAFQKAARAAIQAMREPTNTMLKSGAWAGPFTIDRWQAMIDAALSEASEES